MSTQDYINFDWIRKQSFHAFTIHRFLTVVLLFLILICYMSMEYHKVYLHSRNTYTSLNIKTHFKSKPSLLETSDVDVETKSRHLLAESNYTIPSKVATHKTASSAKDEDKLMDILDFKYIIDQSACENNIQALILVHSGPDNFKKRNIIRTTFGNAKILQHSPLRLLFLVGTVSNASHQAEINYESEKFHDIVQGSFLDHYRNLTYKHVMALKWFASKCANAQILIKIDDDIYANTLQFIKYSIHAQDFRNIQRALPVYVNGVRKDFNASIELFNRPKDLLLCDVSWQAPAQRSFRDKWRVSFAEYPNKYYPPYCLGYAVIYSNDVVSKLLLKAQSLKYFWIDDVFVTGIVAKQCNISPIPLDSYLLDRAYFEELKNSNATSTEQREILFNYHGMSSDDIVTLWRIHKAHIGLMESTITITITTEKGA